MEICEDLQLSIFHYIKQRLISKYSIILLILSYLNIKKDNRGSYFMIYIGKSPYRVSLLGGGSDLDWFVKDKKFGVCLGYSLDKYSYSVLNVLPSISKKGILEYSTREEYTNSNEIVHPIVREVLSFFNIQIYRA